MHAQINTDTRAYAMPIISVALIRPCQDTNDMLPYNYGDLVTKYYYLYFYTLIALSSKEQWLVSVNVSVEETIVVTVMSLLDIRSGKDLIRSVSDYGDAQQTAHNI